MGAKGFEMMIAAGSIDVWRSPRSQRDSGVAYSQDVDRTQLGSRLGFWYHLFRNVTCLIFRENSITYHGLTTARWNLSPLTMVRACKECLHGMPNMTPIQQSHRYSPSFKIAQSCPNSSHTRNLQ